MTANLKSQLERAKTLRDAADNRLKETRQTLKRLNDDLVTLDGVQAIFQKLIDQEVNIGVQAVVQLLTEGLQTVFNDQNLEVKADVAVERGKVAVDLITRQVPSLNSSPDDVIEGDCNESYGGSVATVQSVLLRVIILLRRGLRPALWLDETLGAFDPNYVINMGNFLNTLCDRLGMDLLDVTQNSTLLETAKKAYVIKRIDDQAVFVGER